MSIVRTHMSVTLDGYAAGPNQSLDKPFGDGAEHLNDWWRSNPFLSGVHWASGIEIGLRLISWTWIRALRRMAWAALRVAAGSSAPSANMRAHP